MTEAESRPSSRAADAAPQREGLWTVRPPFDESFGAGKIGLHRRTRARLDNGSAEDALELRYAGIPRQLLKTFHLVPSATWNNVGWVGGLDTKSESGMT